MIAIFVASLLACFAHWSVALRISTSEHENVNGIARQEATAETEIIANEKGQNTKSTLDWQSITDDLENMNIVWQDSRMQEKLEEDWEDFKNNSWYCKSAFRNAICNDSQFLKLKRSTIAAYHMQLTLLGVGSLCVSLVIVLCTIVGIKTSAAPVPLTQRHEAGSPNSFLSKLVTWHDQELSLSRCSFKVFLCILLVIELQGLTLPEMSVLAAPEAVAVIRRHAGHFPHGPDLTAWFMPGLDDSTADMYANNLACARATLLAAWGGYLAMPPNWPGISTALYAWGAVVYFILGSIHLNFIPCHSPQAAMLFIIGAAWAVPQLENQSRKSSWLRFFLIVCCVVPVYLFAGVSKMRYNGWEGMNESEWIKGYLKANAGRSVVGGVTRFIMQNTLILDLLAWGNTMTELILPLMVLFSLSKMFAIFIEACPLLTSESSQLRHRRLVQSRIMIEVVLFLSAIGFHVAIFLLLGPNFIREVLCIALAASSYLDSTGIQSNDSKHENINVDSAVSSYLDSTGMQSNDSKHVNTNIGSAMNATFMDFVRAGILVCVYFSWFYVNIASDVAHINGATHLRQHHDPFWPFSEFSMFASAPKDIDVQHYMKTLLLLLGVCACSLGHILGHIYQCAK